MREKSRIRRSLAVAAAAALTATLTAAGVSQATADSAGGRDGSPISCSAPGHQAITVVMVHGAWADSSGWSGEIKQLQRAGCVVRSADNPVENLTTDSEPADRAASTAARTSSVVRHRAITAGR